MPWKVADVESKKKGLTDEQKRQWVVIANSVREDCLEDGKSEEACDALAIQIANKSVGANVKMEQVVQTNENYSLRRETKNNKTFLVAPVVMMVEGVHCGSHGCLLHTIEELGKFSDAWNGRPVIIYHPQKDGKPISAGVPDVDLYDRVGTVYDTKVEDTKLKAEVWLEENKLQEKSPEAYQYIKNGNPMDVSVGVFTDEEPKEGEWNGKKYVGIAHNHRFDHLALLPNMEGACSWADGCGIRANNKFSNNKRKGGDEMSVKVKEKVNELIANESTHYNEDDREWLGSMSLEQLEKMAPKLQRNEPKKPCCPDEVDYLIKSEKTPFTEDDRDWLSTLDNEQIGKLIPKEEPEKLETNSGDPEKVELTKENLQKVFSEYNKAEDFIALAPKEMQEQLTHGLNIFREERKNMVQEIAKHSEFSEDELGKMDNALLKKMHSSVVPEKGDYSAKGARKVNGGSKEPSKEMKVMLGYTEDE
jgi:hypothetical protein